MNSLIKLRPLYRRSLITLPKLIGNFRFFSVDLTIDNYMKDFYGRFQEQRSADAAL